MRWVMVLSHDVVFAGALAVVGLNTRPATLRSHATYQQYSLLGIQRMRQLPLWPVDTFRGLTCACAHGL